MHSIISQTEQAIELKKKQIDANQQEINHDILLMNDKVRQSYELKREIENLERDLYSLKKTFPNSMLQDTCMTSASCNGFNGNEKR